MKKILMIVGSGIFLLQLAACRVDYANVIYDVNTGSKVFIEPGDSGWREFVVFIDKKQKIFKTLQRYKDDQILKTTNLCLRTFDINGKLLLQQTLPVDFSYYMSECSFSLNGKEIVYFKSESKSLNLYNITTGNDIILIPNVSNTIVDIVKVVFINADEIIVFLANDKDFGRDHDQILLCNLRSRSLKLLHAGKVFLTWGDINISDNRKVIAFPERFLSDSVSLMSTNDFTLKTVSFPHLGYIQSIAWNDSNELAVAHKYVNVYNIKNGKNETIFPMKDDYIVGSLFFINPNKLLAICWKSKSDSDTKECYLIDIQKKELLKKFYLEGHSWQQLDDHTLLFSTLHLFWFWE